MQKIYQRINWENDPSTNTPINEDNLNRIDYAIDQIDNRVVQLSGYQGRVEQSEANAKQYANDSKAYSENAKESENKAKESELKAKEYKEQAFSGTPEGYEALIEQVESIDIKASNEYDLFGTKQGGYRLTDLVGATEQKQLSGKNKVDMSVFNSVSSNGSVSTLYNASTHTVTLNGDMSAGGVGKYKTISGILEQNKTYTISGYFKGTDGIRAKILKNTAVTLTNEYVRHSETFVASGTAVSLIFYFMSASKGDYIQFKDIQIEESDTMTDFEEFCGGTPSPNPELPQVIENYADCVEMEQGFWNSSNQGQKGTGNDCVRATRHIPCNIGDVVKILTEYTYLIRVCYYLKDSYVGTEVVSSGNVGEFTIPSGVDSFAFHISTTDGSDVTPQTVGKITLTINGKNVGQIVEHGKNLFDKTSVTKGKYIFTNGSPVESSDWNHSDYIPAKANTKYTLQSMNSKGSTNPSIALYDENKNYISLHKYSSQNLLSFTTTENTRYVRLSVCSSDLDICQLEEGDATPYEPYTEKITTFYLNEPLRDTDRIVKVDGVWYEEHNRKTVVFDGSESGWTSGSTNAPYGIAISDCEPLNGTPDIKCSHYISVNVMDTWVNYDYLVSIPTSNAKTLLFRDMSVSSLEEFKAKLQANPITVEYPLATPTLTPLDTASQIALNDTVTFDGMTYIEVDSKVKPTSISGEYGTSQVGAYTLKCMNDNDTDRVERAELKAQIETLTSALLVLTSESEGE